MAENEQIELSGTVYDVIYTNEENGYTVLRLDTHGGETVTVTGCLPFAAPGEQLILYGSWMSHPTHGRQFKAEITAKKRAEAAEARARKTLENKDATSVEIRLAEARLKRALVRESVASR